MMEMALHLIRMAVIALALASCAPALEPVETALPLCKPGQRNTPTKTCIVDGDTLWLQGTKYRLKDFETPEPTTGVCGGAAELALAKRASRRLQHLLAHNPWTLETFGPDRTGRRIEATIRIQGQDVGDILISEGMARRWPNGDEWWCRS